MLIEVRISVEGRLLLFSFFFFHALRGEAVVWIRIMELDKQEFKSQATECL